MGRESGVTADPPGRCQRSGMDRSSTEPPRPSPGRATRTRTRGRSAGVAGSSVWRGAPAGRHVSARSISARKASATNVAVAFGDSRDRTWARRRGPRCHPAQVTGRPHRAVLPSQEGLGMRLHVRMDVAIPRDLDPDERAQLLSGGEGTHCSCNAAAPGCIRGTSSAHAATSASSTSTPPTNCTTSSGTCRCSPS